MSDVPELLILGLGNVLCADDGAGVAGPAAMPPLGEGRPALDGPPEERARCPEEVRPRGQIVGQRFLDDVRRQRIRHERAGVGQAPPARRLACEQIDRRSFGVPQSIGRPVDPDATRGELLPCVDAGGPDELILCEPP